MCVFLFKTHTIQNLFTKHKNSTHAYKSVGAVLYSGAESNRYQRFRKPLFYPLNYRSLYV